MATRNSNEVEPGRSRARRKRTQTRLLKRASYAAAGCVKSFECVISGKRYDFDDDISSGAHGRGRRVNHEQAGCAAADKHESLAERLQRACN